jgi:hypothetical protein
MKFVGVTCGLDGPIFWVFASILLSFGDKKAEQIVLLSHGYGKNEVIDRTIRFMP